MVSASEIFTAKRAKGFFQPALAWVIILGFVLVTTVCVFTGAGKILNYIFPVGAFFVGVLLYFRAPLLYVGFGWWMWFIAPFVRRLADYRGAGFTNPSPILLAPYLVAFVAIITLYRHLPKLYSGGLPFVIALSGVIYGFLIGLINKEPQQALIALLDWLAPLLIGFHLFVNWRDYPSYRQNLERTFVWGVLIMGGYGIIQFLVAPEWERFWLTNAAIVSAGTPEPLGIRVWATMSSPEPFAAVMAAGLLLLFCSQSVLRIPASVVGYLALLLSLVRAAWLGWFAGLLSLTSSLKPKLQMRLLITILVMAIGVIPLATIEPFSEVINTRLETLSDVQNDGSAQVRQETFANLIGSALVSYLGEGIGGEGYDSTVLLLPLHLGWLGTIPYVGGMLALTFALFQSSEGKLDPFVGASRAIIVSCIIRFPVNGVTLESSGAVLWTFLGIGTAAITYYRQQRVEMVCSLSQQLTPNGFRSLNEAKFD